MPPQVTFVKIADNLSIPIKIFVKKSATTKLSTSSSSSKSIEINSKYLININYQPYHIQLSKNQLNSIINKLKPKILPILIYNNHDQSITNIETQQLIINDEEDTLKIIIPQQTILNVRARLRLINYENFITNSGSGNGNGNGQVNVSELEITSLWKKIGNSEHNNNLKMLTVKKDFKFPKDSEKEDTKDVKFKLKQNYIIDNSKDCIKVYIN